MLFPNVISTLTKDGSIVNIEDKTEVPFELLVKGENTSGKQDTHMGLLERTVRVFAEEAYRTILVCYRDMTYQQYEELKYNNGGFEKETDKEILERDLTAIGIFGIQDPLRETIVPSIEMCKEAGI